MRTRKVVKNKSQLQRYITQMNGKENITTTVYGFRELKPAGNRCEYTTAIVPHFVMDLDAGRAESVLGMSPNEAGERCVRDTRELVNMLMKGGWKHATWFTGGGFHVWVALDQTHELPPEEMADFLFSGRSMVNKWVRDMDLVTLDPVVSFRPDRHIRIPNSFNFKRNVWSVPMTPGTMSQGWDFIQMYATKPMPGMLLMGDKGMHITIVKRDPGNPFSATAVNHEKFDAEDIEIEMGRVGSIPMLPCLAAGACEPGSNPPHTHRAYLMMYLLDFFRRFARPPSSSDVSDREAISKAHGVIASIGWADYKKEVTQKMLTHGASRHYQTPTCRTLYREGLCVGKCPYYDDKGEN